MDLLSLNRPVLLDGATGTWLQDHGLDDGGSGELWNVDRPDVVRSLHEAYAEAGSQVLTTNTFGGTRPRLDMHGLGDRVFELNQAGARLAREVADRHDLLVAGDVGPTGELMAPLGTMDQAAAQEIFAAQISGLAAGGADLVLVETLSDLAEATAALAAAHEVAPGLPVLVTMSFDTNLRTMMGVRPADAVRALADAGATGVGANCGRGPEEMETIAAEMTVARNQIGADTSGGLLLVAQSNAGLPQVSGDGFVYTAGPGDMAAHAARLVDLGIDAVGGCCGSTPDHVRAMADALGVRV